MSHVEVSFLIKRTQKASIYTLNKMESNPPRSPQQKPQGKTFNVISTKF